MKYLSQNYGSTAFLMRAPPEFWDGFEMDCNMGRLSGQVVGQIHPLARA